MIPSGRTGVPIRNSDGLFNNTPKTLGRDPIEKVDKPFGQWNTFRIKQIGARTWVTYNNRLVVDGAMFEPYFDKAQPRSAWTDHAANAWWRDSLAKHLHSRDRRGRGQGLCCGQSGAAQPDAL
ncbi:MAG: family 16 glycoside hydrolase [Verrucomicrobiales bacterium]